MNDVHRRGFLIGTVAAAGLASSPSASAAIAARVHGVQPPHDITPGDLRYADLVRGNNHRFVGTPTYVHVATSTDEVVAAVEKAVSAGKRIAVRGGGHCAEDFWANSSVRAVVDLSQMAEVSYDARRRAFAIESGAMLDGVYRTLFKRWGVTIPAGSAPTVGVGGHLCGGGYGSLSRRHGSVVDHLYGVEVVVVDRTGRARTVVATREDADPNRDLWWAHTGGGGGNFGVVTKYWMRSPGAIATDPALVLPRPPSSVLISTIVWPWSSMDARSFARLISNHGTWHERNSDPDSPYAGLYSVLAVTHRSAGALALFIQCDATTRDGRRRYDEYVSAICDGVGVTPIAPEPSIVPWLHATVWPGDRDGGDMLTRRYKMKAAYLRKSFTDRQISTAYRHLSRSDFDNPQGVMLLIGYGGRVNAVASSATAVAQRDSVLKVAYESFWATPQDDAKNISWLREFYYDMYADTGGVPTSGPINDGSYINYPDKDLADPRWNKSGVAWSTLYYKDNYRRLQEVKSRWDPLNIFRHALSIEPLGE